MRKFAFYLPQFYETNENNKWWGKGFTEWSHVKNAKPLYKNHNQPISPLKDNYYNLLNKDTVLQQTELMNKYHIDGLIYYHYYFCGKLLLEKPAQNLLKWTDINQPFFFCWANHTWYKSQNNKKQTLLEQTYGNKDDWNKHFEYCLPFFQDSRYEKIDNKPVLMLFNSSFPEKKNIISFFNSKCIENGFSGIYVIETYQPKTLDYEKEILTFKENLSLPSARIFFREPTNCNLIYLYKIKHTYKYIYLLFLNLLSWLGCNKNIPIYDGDILYDIMINYKSFSPEYIRGMFFSWDNTPRHKYNGYVITKPSKEKVFQYLDYIKKNDYIFINAWNEWAEGMILEPTASEGYENLEWIKEWTELNS